jgi:hypothetical protein
MVINLGQHQQLPPPPLEKTQAVRSLFYLLAFAESETADQHIMCACAFECMCTAAAAAYAYEFMRAYVPHIF